jgi:hypothetical protein
VSAQCEGKLRRIQFRLQDPEETVRAAIDSLSEELENAEAKRNDHLIRHNVELSSYVQRSASGIFSTGRHSIGSMKCAICPRLTKPRLLGGKVLSGGNGRLLSLLTRFHPSDIDVAVRRQLHRIFAIRYFVVMEREFPAFFAHSLSHILSHCNALSMQYATAVFSAGKMEHP